MVYSFLLVLVKWSTIPTYWIHPPNFTSTLAGLKRNTEPDRSVDSDQSWSVDLDRSVDVIESVCRIQMAGYGRKIGHSVYCRLGFRYFNNCVSSVNNLYFLSSTSWIIFFQSLYCVPLYAIISLRPKLYSFYLMGNKWNYNSFLFIYYNFIFPLRSLATYHLLPW